MQVYQTDDVIVTYDAARCPRCSRRATGPWIRPALGAADDVMRAVASCPTGALHAVLSRLAQDGSAAPLPEAPADEAWVRPARRGPLFVAGPVEVRAEDGRRLVRDTRVALCRCGRSATQPLCDGTHAKVGFEG